MTFILSLLLTVSSCQKTEKMQTFNDIFDTSGIETLNERFRTARTVADLPLELGTAGFSVPEGIKNITPESIAAWYKKNMVLSGTEVDLLLKNDSRTYIDVINRMASFPPEMGKLKSEDFNSLKASVLNKYALKQLEETENFYSTDYYSAILALQNYLKIAVIAPMESVAGDPPVVTVPPGSGQYPNPPVYILYFKMITMNNIWDMWWTYWSDGTRTKHKGAAGSFPG